MIQETLLYIGIGFSVVFVGLLCLIGIISLMSFIVRLVKNEKPVKKRKTADEVVPVYEHVSVPAEAPGAPASALIGPDRQSLIAAVSAAVAEFMGEDVEGIRIHSIKRIGGKAPDPDRRKMIAAISAAIAAQMGTDVSGIRIRSIRKLS